MSEEGLDLPKPMASPSSTESLINLSPSESPLNNNEANTLTDSVLPPDEAFLFSVHLTDSGILVAHWDIAHGYYLYRDKFSFLVKEGNQILGEPELPAGIVKMDIKYGATEIYEYGVDIKIPVRNSSELAQFTLTTTYQGCAENKLCYPPLEKTSVISFSKAAAKSLEFEPSALDNSVDNISSTEVPTVALAEDKFLTAAEAFILSVSSPAKTQIVLQWQIADGYYLYRDKMNFSLSKEGQLVPPQLPPATFRHDPLFGQVAIYTQSPLEIILPVTMVDAKAGAEAVTLTVEYQGCALAGLCYPPTQQVMVVALGQGQVEVAEADRIANLLASASLWYTLALFFGFGLLLSLTPCVYPMIPILSSLIVGQGDRVNTYAAFNMSVVYVLAMSFTYAIAGALTGLLGENLQVAFQNPWILGSFSLVFIALALSMFGCYELQLPATLQTKLTHWSNQQQGGQLVGVAIMGILSALIVGPCIAAPLAGALIYISQTGDAMLGGVALFVMGVGMGIPLILIGTSAGHWLPKKGEWMEAVKAVFGVLLLGVAIWMLARILPALVTMLLWASLLILSAVYMGALDQLSVGVSGWQKLWKGLGVILLIYGILLMVGAASGHFNLWQPLPGMTGLGPSSKKEVTTVSFKPIKGVAEFERELALARTQNKPVLLDFYADWCISCKELEQFTFTDPAVQTLLTKWMLLRGDVTANDELDKALYKKFGIYGPPAILFFSPNGQEQRNYRVVGFMDAVEFRSHLLKVLP